MKRSFKKERMLLLLVFAGLAAALYAGWRWVGQVPEPPPYRAADAEKTPVTTAVKQSEAVAEDAIRIGLIAPITGRPAGMPPLLQDAVRFAVDRINTAGGILGHPVELLEFDNRSTPIGARQAAREAVSKNVSAVIGGWYSSTAMAAASTLQNVGVPMIAIGASHPDVTRVGDCIFRVQFLDHFQGAVMAEYAYRSLSARRAAVLVDVGNNYSPYLGDVFCEQFRQFGGEILLREEFLGDGTDFSALIHLLQNPAIDVIFLPAYEKESAAVMKAARAKGIRTPFLGADGWGPDMITYGGEAVQGAAYTRAWHPDGKQIQGLREVYDAWVEANGPIMRDAVALSLDAAHLLFSAIESAGSPDPGKIREALARTRDFRGISGSYTFDPNGDSLKPIQIVEIVASGLRLLKSVTPKNVRLGVIFAKTGDAAATNTMGFEAARFAVEKINRKGGVLGRNIRLLEYDNESTPLGSRNAAEAAVKDQVLAVVGASYSSHSSAMVPVLQAAGIPMVSPASTNPKVTRFGDCIFRVCFTDRIQGRVMAEFALHSLGAETAMVLTNTDNQYSVDLARFFMERFRSEGTVLGELDYLQDDTDFSDILKTVRRLRPKVVFVPGYPRDSAFILKQARDLGVSAIFLGGDGWDDIMYDFSMTGIDGNYFAEHWHIDMPNPRSLQFVAEYSRNHRFYRTGLIPLTCDAVDLIADAIRRAGAFQPADIRTALAETTDFKGITGDIRFDEFGDPVKPVVILKFEKGTAVLHDIVSPE